MSKVGKENAGVGTLIFLAWLVYSISYLGKVNYSANITQVIDFYHVTKAEAGIVPTFFFFAYGIGQVVNGIFCKKYNIKWMVFISLFLSAVINLIIAVTTVFDVIKWLWMVNGFLLSILWPTLVRLLSETLPQRALGKSSVVMGTTVATGTLIIYALSSLYVAFDKFKLAFYTAAFAGIIVAIIWLMSYKKIVSEAKKHMTEDEELIKNSDAGKENSTKHKEKNIIIASLCILCFCAIGVNLIKDGLATWVPLILKEEGSVPDYLSILLTLLLPIVAIFANAFALDVHKRIPSYVVHCLVVFVVMAGLTGVVIGLLSAKNVILLLIGMVAVKYLASSLNSLITSIYPMFMRRNINSGLCAGVLNGFCYLGSTISSYGLGSIADNFGWSAVFYFLFWVCVATAVICGIYLFIQHFLEKKWNI